MLIIIKDSVEREEYTVKDLARIEGMSMGTANNIIMLTKDLGCSPTKISERWIPHFLSEKQKAYSAKKIHCN